ASTGRTRAYSVIMCPPPGAVRSSFLSEADQRERSAYLEVYADVPKAVDLLLDDDAAGLRDLFEGFGLSGTVVESYVGPMRDPQALAGALNWYAALQRERIPTGVARVPTAYVWGTFDFAVGRAAARACGGDVGADYQL